MLRLSVRYWIGVSLLPASICSSARSQVPTSSTTHQQIIVRIRNGKTGLPIWLASPYVFLGKTDPQSFTNSYRRTKFWGDAKVDVTGTSPREVRVWVDFLHRDCRVSESDPTYRGFDYAGHTLDTIAIYNLDTVLRIGVVAPNLCGSKTQAPEPGVLTIYVIPATFKELWDK
jgi:hypothetical protein